MQESVYLRIRYVGQPGYGDQAHELVVHDFGTTYLTVDHALIEQGPQEGRWRVLALQHRLPG